MRFYHINYYKIRQYFQLSRQLYSVKNQFNHWHSAINYCGRQQFVNTTFLLTEPNVVPPGYMTFRDIGEQSESICYRDVTSPINELDGQSNSSRGEKHTITSVVTSETHHWKRYTCVWKKYCIWQVMSFEICQRISLYDTTTDDSPFFDNDMPTMRSSSSSSEGLPHVIGLNWEGSVESNEVKTRAQKSHSLSESPDLI